MEFELVHVFQRKRKGRRKKAKNDKLQPPHIKEKGKKKRSGVREGRGNRRAPVISSFFTYP